MTDRLLSSRKSVLSKDDHDEVLDAHISYHRRCAVLAMMNLFLTARYGCVALPVVAETMKLKCRSLSCLLLSLMFALMLAWSLWMSWSLTVHLHGTRASACSSGLMFCSHGEFVDDSVETASAACIPASNHYAKCISSIMSCALS